jgi:hypothetical protein
MDVTFGMYAEAVVRCLEKHGVFREWQTIETAPKDKTRVLIYASPYDDLPGFQTVAYYHPHGGWCVDELRDATYWQSLPPPPEET